MAGSIQKFFEFNADFDAWEIYVERLEQHFTACKIKEESIKIAILLSSVGPATYKLLRDLSFPDLPKDKTYQNLCDILKSQFGVQVSVWRERKKFYEIRQGDETIAEWYAKIRSYAINCKFGTDLNKIIKDKFITGLASGKILDRLCEEGEDKPLEELLSLALKTENQATIRYVSNSNFPPNTGNRMNRMHQQRQQVTSSESRNRDTNRSNSRTNGVQDSQQGSRRFPANVKGNPTFQKKIIEKCKHCNQKHKRECYFKNSKCQICFKTGHIAKNCYKARDVNFIAENDTVESESLFYCENLPNIQSLNSICNFTDEQNDNFKVDIVINGSEEITFCLRDTMEKPLLRRVTL